MLLRYTNTEGKQVEVVLGPQPVTIGRDPEADIVVPSEKASRIHCGIQCWDGDYVIKDLKSRNGTFVNDERIDVAILRSGDAIRVGGTLLTVDRQHAKGTTTIIREVAAEMADEGKGYKTILREIVQSTGDKPKSK